MLVGRIDGELLASKKLPLSLLGKLLLPSIMALAVHRGFTMVLQAYLLLRGVSTIELVAAALKSVQKSIPCPALTHRHGG
jgi:hypothetical protein